MSEIKTEKTVSGYRVNFPTEKIVIAVSHLQRHSDGQMKGSLSLTLGKNQQQEPTFSFNFTSDIARSRVVNTLNAKYPEWKWLPIIDDLVRTVQALAGAGEDGTIIQPTVSGVKHPGYYIEPVIMKGVPNIIYGDKGVNKTTLGLTMFALVGVGEKNTDTGLIVSDTAKVALLDWENNRDLTDYTLSRLVTGQTIPYFEMPYLRCRLPLADDMERIGSFLYKHKVNTILVDSLGKAAGSDRFDSSGKNAALRFFECLDTFEIPGLTSLILAQNAKGEDSKKTIYGSTYFTYYARNIFELRAKKDELDSDIAHAALFHMESNYSKKYEPIGFRLSYTDDSISIVSESVTLSAFLERASQTKILLEFLKDGAKTNQAISNELQTSVKHTSVLLNRLQKRKAVINLGSGMWGLVAEDIV